MIELIVLIIFLVSAAGVAFILMRKAPALAALPRNGKTGINIKFVSGIAKEFENISSLFKNQILLHKVLSWTKCLILKAETKIDSLLHRIRRKAKEEKLSKKR